VAETIFQTLSIFFARYGYWAVFFGVMLENCGVPVPGETVLLFAGFLAYQGDLQLGRIIVTAIAGATLGDTTGYCLGRFGGRALVERLRRRAGFFARHFDRAQSIYLKHGQWAVFVARFITGLRVFSGILAGSFRMSYARFLVFDFSGAVIWASTVASVGFFFGSNWESLVHFVKMFDRGILALGALGIIVAGAVYYLKGRKLAGKKSE
jgi:membrane protein DedA with SNARE-associated domain